MAKRKPREEIADDGLDARTLPHSLEAEKSVLGAVLVHHQLVDDAMHVLHPDDFYRDAHRRIFAAMVELAERKLPIDIVLLKEELGRRGDLDEVGGPAYLASMTDGVPRSMNVAHYAGIVREKARLRALIFAANEILTDAYAAEDPVDKLIADADRRLLDVQRITMSGRTIDIRDGLTSLLAAVDDRIANRGTLIGVDTGFKSLNDLTFGWQAGDLVVIAARPSIGKTTFAVNSATVPLLAGRRAAMFSLEMRRRQLEFRLLSALSGVPLTRIISGYLMSLDYPKLAQAMGQMGEMSFAIDDRTGLRVEDIRGTCRRLRAERGLDLVIIDYVQQMAGSLEARTTRNEQVTDISRRLKAMADELSVPVLLLSQLSRANEKRADPRPRLSDLRESGALEQDADIVVFLHRANHRAGGVTECIVEKQRMGPTGTVLLSLDRDIVKFNDAGAQEPEPEPAQAPLSEDLKPVEKPRRWRRTSE